MGSNPNTITLCEVNVNGLGSNGKRNKNMKWMKRTTDIMVLTDTRVGEDHNFWTQLSPKAVAVVAPSQKARGVAILSFAEGIRFKEVIKHGSGRLVGVTVCSAHLEFRLITAYLPAQACVRATFLTDCLTPFVQGQPVSLHLVLMGDLNLVEDPERDRSSRARSASEDVRLRKFWPAHDLRDAFRALHPSRWEFTFYSRLSQTSSRIGRALVSLSALGLLSKEKHVCVRKSLSDHWFAIRVGFSLAASLEKGVKSVTKKVLRKLEGKLDCGQDKTLRLVTAGLRAHTREEKKRVKATSEHLEKEVEVVRHAVMQRPRHKGLQNRLIKAEAQLEAYLEREKERLQVLAGINVELNGEVLTPYLTAKVKIRKKRTVVHEVNHNGIMYRGTREVLKAVEEHFGAAFWEVDTEEEVDWASFAAGPRLSGPDVKELEKG
ncbi:unnamed protein product [Closterium sp. Yama58-4]|nr:unnamed protein product [Closterium sp. Yama58-4]